MNYSVNILMDNQTVSMLRQNYYNLLCLKAVKGPAGGQPAVWLSMRNFTPFTSIQWSENYQSYISVTQLMPGVTIAAMESKNISPGQTITINPGGVLSLDPSGTPDIFTIKNMENRQLTTGISSLINGMFSPICGFPISNGASLQITPLDKIFLMFTSMSVNQGVIIDNSYSQGILIDMSGAQTRDVSYNIDSGWSSTGPGTQIVPPNFSLITLLT